MPARSAPTQPRAGAEAEARDQHGFTAGTETEPGTDAAVVMADVTVPPGSGRPWHTHPAPAVVISLEGDFAFLAGHVGHVQVVSVPPGASVWIPAELPHACTNAGQQRGRLLVALATDLAGFSAQTGLPGCTAVHVATSDRSSAAWRRVLVQQYHLAETGLLAVRNPICCACGVAAQTQQDMPYVRQQDAWFCAGCWHRLSATEIEGAVQDIALRGVPLS